MAAGARHAFAVFLVLVNLRQSWQLTETTTTPPKTFTFMEFPYKETGKNEQLFREFEQACEQSGACVSLEHQGNSIAKIRCIRECVSPSCYQDIYMFDQLEEGEIDVRLNSFKGCFMQRNARPRK